MTASVHVGQVYRSNAGKGPLRAKIVAMMRGDEVRLYRWSERGSSGARRVYFTLTLRYLQSPRCGWKLIR